MAAASSKPAHVGAKAKLLAFASMLRAPTGLVGTSWQEARTLAKEGFREGHVLALQKQLLSYPSLEEANRVRIYV